MLRQRRRSESTSSDTPTPTIHVNPLATKRTNHQSIPQQPLVEWVQHVERVSEREFQAEGEMDSCFLDIICHQLLATVLFSLPIFSPEVQSRIENSLLGHSMAAKRAIGHLRRRMAVPFERGNQEHEAILESIWDRVTDSSPRTGGRYTKEWGRLGFQGKDPATDFRGAGLLGLDVLHHFSGEYVETVRAICDVENTDARPNSFPLALATISVVDALVKYLEAHPFTANVIFRGCDSEMQEPEQACQVFYELFGRVFTSFARHHREAIEAFVARGGVPEMAVMQYNSIHRGFFDQMATSGKLAEEWQRDHVRCARPGYKCQQFSPHLSHQLQPYGAAAAH